MRESEVKLNIVRAIRKERGYARRIEDRFSVGMPDIVLIPVGCPVVWLEVKVLHGYILRPSMRQHLELQNLIIPPHSYALMCGWKEGTLYLHPPIEEIHIRHCVRQEQHETPADLIRRAIKKDPRYVVKEKVVSIPQKPAPTGRREPGDGSPPSAA